MVNKCGSLGLFFIALLFCLPVIQLEAQASDGQNSKPNTVSTTWCLKQVETVSKKENECGRKLSETRIELAKSKGQRASVVEKLGIAAIGGFVVATQFNPVGLVIGGYLILFQ